MTGPRLRQARWQAALVAVAIVLAFSGGAVAKGKYDAKNADKVDGKHAVSAGASVAKRRGKLVATNATTGRLPTNIVAASPVLSVPPQGVAVAGNASMSQDGPVLQPTGTGALELGFVVPPGHVSGTPLRVDVVYREDSSAACSWSVQTSGLEGPDSPTGSDIHNGAWFVPGTSNYSGAISVPAGDGMVHTATFAWPFDDNPGMFIQFELDRVGNDAADSCGSVLVYGLQVRY